MKKKPEDKPKAMTVILDAQIYKQIKEISIKEGILMKWMVNTAVSQWLGRRGQE